MPGWLPFPRALVLLSGALEIIGGLALLSERTRRAAGFGLVLLLLAVWPANFQMLRDAHAADVAAGWEALLWLRLPLQLLLIVWVWRAARLGGADA